MLRALETLIAGRVGGRLCAASSLCNFLGSVDGGERAAPLSRDPLVRLTCQRYRLRPATFISGGTDSVVRSGERTGLGFRPGIHIDRDYSESNRSESLSSHRFTAALAQPPVQARRAP